MIKVESHPYNDATHNELTLINESNVNTISKHDQ